MDDQERAKSPRTSVGRLVALILVLAPNHLALAQDEARNGYSQADRIDEIIVTAQRRGPERLQDVPMSVSVVDSESIRRNGMVEMNDYLRELPSVSFLDHGPGQNNVIIRGIATNKLRDETTGIYIGDTPVTSLGVAWRGDPDLKLVDIDRIEVLRGPQGTLYGEGSMGGTVRIVPAAPNPERFESQVTGSFGVTGAEGGNNSTLEGMLNLPLLDGDAALRIVAYRHDNSGYFRNVVGSDLVARSWSEYFGVPATDKSDVGATTFTGWRAQLLWQPKPELSVKLTALSQDVGETGSSPPGEHELEKFQQVRLSKLNGGGSRSDMDFDLANLEVVYDFHAFSMLSTTSLVESWADYDQTNPVLETMFGYDAIPVFQQWGGPNRSFIQELRMTSRQAGKLRYLAGVFYQDVESSIDNIWSYEGDPAFDPWEGATILDALGEYDQEQMALFGELTYDLTDRLTGTVGARWFRYDQETLWTGGGLVVGEDDGVLLTVGEGDGQNYSLKLEYEASESTQLYGSFNQGFRFGGSQEQLPSICDQDGDGIIDGTDIPISKKIDSDTVDSYELGVRFRSSGGRVAVNATVFHADWTDIPVSVNVPCGPVPAYFPQIYNLGKAESQGLELEGTWEIIEGLTFNYAASWVDAKLAKDTESLGEAGDRLPGSPQHNLNLGIEQDFRIGQRRAFVRADLVNVGEYYDNLQQEGEAAGGYTTIGARAGLSIDDWLVELYVHNLTDEFAFTHFGFGGFGLYWALRPRTVGVQASYLFTGQ